MGREWPYGAVTFSTSRLGFDVDFYIEPASNLAGVVIRELGRISIRLELSGVAEVEVDRLHGDEDLLIDFSSEPGPSAAVDLEAGDTAHLGNERPLVADMPVVPFHDTNALGLDHG